MTVDLVTVFSVVSVAAAIVSVSIAVFTYLSQKRFSKAQHLLPSVDRLMRVLHDMNGSTSMARMLPSAVTELQKEHQPLMPSTLPFLKMNTYTFLFGVQYTFTLNQYCSEFLVLHKQLEKEGTIEGIRRLDNALVWKLNEMKNATTDFLKLDIKKLLDIERKSNETLMNISEEISDAAGLIDKTSAVCIAKLNKIL
jgi:hypothetical protein